MTVATAWAAQAARAAVALLAAAGGAALAWRHPLAPVAATLAFAGWCAASARWPRLWLFVVPAALPLANLLPWTGWLAFDEFDLLLLGALAGGYARWAAVSGPAAAAQWRFTASRWRPPAGDAADSAGRRLPVAESDPCAVGSGNGVAALGAAAVTGSVRRPTAGIEPGPALAALCFLLFSAVAFVRGLVDAGGTAGGVFEGYTGALNAWRVFKPLPYALLAVPLAWQATAHEPTQALRRFGSGMLAGLWVVSLAVLWERAAYAGLIGGSDRYRATALFWETHLGGAAIDGYLVLALPFVARALDAARTPWRWAAAAALALLAAHATLAAFSRGLYGAAVLSLIVFVALRRHRRREDMAAGPVAPRWRTRANALLAVALALECAAVFQAGGFARERIADSAADLGSRLDHWRSGIGLLHGGGDWLFGIGAGRLPARYLQSADGHERSGALQLIERDHAGHSMQVSGPARRRDLGGRYALAQRVDLQAEPQFVRLKIRSLRDAELQLRVCERHLLYARRCASATARLAAADGRWQRATLPLVTAPGGVLPSRGAWYAPRAGLFTLAVLTPGATVELAEIGLLGTSDGELLANGGFSAGFAHWFPAAQGHFLPWHVDNLYLEVLIERGLPALLAFVALLVLAVRSLLRAGGGMASGVAASLVGAAAIGLVVSLHDMPRIAFLLLFLMLSAAGAARPGRCGRRRNPPS